MPDPGGGAGGMSGIARAALEWGMARLHDGEWKRPSGGGETAAGRQGEREAAREASKFRAARPT